MISNCKIEVLNYNLHSIFKVVFIKRKKQLFVYQALLLSELVQYRNMCKNSKETVSRKINIGMQGDVQA